MLKSIPLSKDQIAVTLLLIFYGVGIIGLLSPYKDSFVMLTPLNLLISMAIIVWRHPVDFKPLMWLLMIAYAVGFSIEILGVQTGIIFGSYEYGEVLGWKILGTPLMIGVNWAMLVYGSGSLVNQFTPKLPIWLKAIIGAGLMTLLDFFIEPVAMDRNFWSWAGDIIPLQNYIAWFIIALPLQITYFILLDKTVNKTASILFVLQFIFFTTLQP